MANEIEYKFSEPLDREGRNILFVKFVVSSGNAQLREFVVSQQLNMKGKTAEIIRFDGSIKERVNCHGFYLNPPEKRYLSDSMSYETAERFILTIRNNWHVYTAKYTESHNI